jgi:hypothetical protein
MKSLFLFLLLFTSYILNGQAHEQLSVFQLTEQNTSEQTIVIPIRSSAEGSPFISLALKSQKNEIHLIEYRFYNNQSWSEWNNFKNDTHNNSDNQDISTLIFLPNSIQKIEIKLNSYIPKSDDELHLFYPNHSTNNDLSVRNAQQLLECPCPQPSFKGRDQWCQNANCPTDITPIITEVSHLIIHHTAGSNTSSDWSSVVYAIWNYHVNTNGWDDIGYNWLIDPNGVIYEGRADNIQGAHFCGKNGNTMGVCILGTYTDVEPSFQSMNSIKRLFAWKSCKEDIDPNGIAYHPPSDEEIFTVSGHRDGCATACPGDMLYDLIPDLRDSIEHEISFSCSNILPPVQLTAVAINNQSVQLNWVDQSDNETSFIIERKLENSSYFYPTSTSAMDVTSYQDNIQLDDQTLSYRVLAANEQDTSIYSNMAEVQISASLSHTNKQESFNIYPSIFQDKINVVNYNSNHCSVKVFDTKGSILFNSGFNEVETLNIDTHDWKPGIYVIHIQTSDSEFSKKIIKSNE